MQTRAWLSRTRAAQRQAELQRLADLLARLRTTAACCVWLAPALLRDRRLLRLSRSAEPALELLYLGDQRPHLCRPHRRLSAHQLSADNPKVADLILQTQAWVRAPA